MAFSSATFAPRGLYGGKLVLAKEGLTFTLSRYSAVPGVQVDRKGLVRRRRPAAPVQGHVRVSGPAAVAGTLTFSNTSIAGKLGGRRVKGSY